jgi:hypothetical protein
MCFVAAWLAVSRLAAAAINLLTKKCAVIFTWFADGLAR